MNWNNPRNKSGVLSLITALCMVSSSAFAGSTNQTDRLLEHLIGHWTLTGTIAGRKTMHEAIVFISVQSNSGEYSCLWLDSTASWGLSAEAIGRAKPRDNSIPFTFKDPDGHVSFENTFSYNPGADTWMWSMDNIEEGKHKPFGRVTLKRAKP